jgi:hypothetical protein
MSSIKGAERKALRKALGEAFQSYEPLHRMGLDQLDFDLNSVTHAGEGVITAAEGLIQEMDESAGRTGVVRLIEAARAERPSNPALREVERIFTHTADPLGDVHPTAPVADKVSTKAGLERVIVDAAGFPRFADVFNKLGPAEFRICLVGYVAEGKQVYGTGFLIADDLVMTNDHVIACARMANQAGSAMDLTFGYRSKESHTARYKLAEADWLVASNGVLDYAILRVAGTPGSDPLVPSSTTERGYFRLVSETPQTNEPLLILQHPYDKLDGSPSTLRLTIGFVLAPEAGHSPHVIRHSANTTEGSSGSPVFTGRMDLIALHNWGGPKNNEAIRAGSIKDHLAATGHKDLLQ